MNTGHDNDPTDRTGQPDQAADGSADPQLALFDLPSAETAERSAPSFWAKPVNEVALAKAVAVALIALLPVQTAAAGWLYGQQRSAVTVHLSPAGPVPAVSESDFAARVYAKTAPSVVMIVGSDGNEVGTGFFVGKGTIVTNAHVVSSAVPRSGDLERARPVTVTLSDGREREGTVIRYDSRLDLAIVSVDGVDDIAPLELYTGPVQPGAQIAVIGSPFGLWSSVTTGVVSFPRRNTDLRVSPVQANLLQIDAAVNPGNSGGPVLDAAGRVLGVVTLRPDELQGRSVLGVSFALPSEDVLTSLQAAADGLVSQYVYLGVQGRSATSDDFVAQGALVQDVMPGSPAAAAGVVKGDVIVGLGGVTIRSYEDLISAVRVHRAGQKTTVVVARGPKQIRLRVTFQIRPDAK